MRVDDIGEIQIKAPVRALMVGRYDNVALLLNDVKAGEAIVLNSGRVEIAAEDMQAGHRVAATHLAAGQRIITYGQVIGTALRPIRPGECIQFNNLNLA